MIKELEDVCAITPDSIVENAYVATFIFAKATTTIRIVVKDPQSGADIAITNMTTLPTSERGGGHGRSAVQKLLRIALKNGLSNIQAVQVQSGKESFWQKNGFQATGNATKDFVYVPTGDTSL